MHFLTATYGVFFTFPYTCIRWQSSSHNNWSQHCRTDVDCMLETQASGGGESWTNIYFSDGEYFPQGGYVNNQNCGIRTQYLKSGNYTKKKNNLPSGALINPKMWLDLTRFKTSTTRPSLSISRTLSVWKPIFFGLQLKKPAKVISGFNKLVLHAHTKWGWIWLYCAKNFLVV